MHATGDTHALSVQATALLEAMRSRPDDRRSAQEWLELAGESSAGGDDGEALMEGLAVIGLVGSRRP